eukprot:6757167-Pyramimonas_sp.AAC.1
MAAKQAAIRDLQAGAQTYAGQIKARIDEAKAKAVADAMRLREAKKRKTTDQHAAAQQQQQQWQTAACPAASASAP